MVTAETSSTSLLKSLDKMVMLTSRKVSQVSTLALVVLYFKELDQLKSFLRSLDGNINLLIGENTSTLVAARKDRSVASVFIKNN